MTTRRACPLCGSRFKPYGLGALLGGLAHAGWNTFRLTVLTVGRALITRRR